MKHRILIIGFISGAIAVGFGAFGAHALKEFLIETERVETYQTAVEYHFYHTFGIIILGILHGLFNRSRIETSAWIMLIGIILFSGSLYALCFTGLGIIAWITPIGGIVLIFSWLSAAYAFWKIDK
jgi:uncharacterized membrane protein YgdD (TMEM256/DUF423 family)